MKSWMSKWGVLVLTATAGMFLLLISEWIPNDLGHAFVRELGFACLVACGLAITIDRLARNELNDAIARQVGAAITQMGQQELQDIIRVLMPNEVFELVRGSVIAAAFYREEDDWLISFGKRTNGRVSCVFSGAYVVRNRSNQPTSYTIGYAQYGIFEDNSPSHDRVQKLSYAVAHGESDFGVDTSLNRHELRSQGFLVDEGGGADAMAAEVVRVSVLLHPDERLKVVLDILTSFREEDHEAFVTASPGRKMKVMATYDPTELEVVGATTHPSQRAGQFRTDGQAGARTWTINSALLPGHGIDLYWRPVQVRPVGETLD